MGQVGRVAENPMTLARAALPARPTRPAAATRPVFFAILLASASTAESRQRSDAE